jgi:hypothetical protein
LAEAFGPPRQIAFVVPDLQGALAVWWEGYGIGPWRIWEFGPSNMDAQEVEEEPGSFATLAAFSAWGSFEIELLQPLDEAGPYAASLSDHHGLPHVHHIRCKPPDFAAALAAGEEAGLVAAAGGSLDRAVFRLLDAVSEIGTVIEISHMPEDQELPPPLAVYPPDHAISAELDRN